MLPRQLILQLNALVHRIDRKEICLQIRVPVRAVGAQDGLHVSRGGRLSGANPLADDILHLPGLSNHLLLGIRGWSWRALEAAVGVQRLILGVARRTAGRVDQDVETGFVMGFSNAAAPIRAEQRLHILRCVFACVDQAS